MPRLYRLGSLVVIAGLAATAGFWTRDRVVERTTAAEVRQTTTDPNAVQVTGVSAAHRDGQTFITWTDVTPAPQTGATMDEMRALRRALTDTKGIRYRVYRSHRPITRVSDATLIGEAPPLSGWNAGHYGKDPNPKSQARWFVIQDGGPALAPGAGLFVYHPAETGAAHYAVTVETSGVENQRLAEANRSPPVSEEPGPSPPVLQRTDRPRSFNFIENSTLQFYVRWERAGNTSRPGQPFDYLVAIPDGVKFPAPVGIHLHAWGGSMFDGYGWWFNASKGAILIASNQEPYDWWTGYHERYYGARAADWADGVVRPYTENRLLSFVDWLATRVKLDPSRMFTAGLSMGGSGALMMAIRHPSRIAWAVSWVGVHVPRDSPQFRSSYELVWGKPEWNVKFEDGTPVWDYYSDPAYLRRHPDRDVPFLTFSNGKNDGAIGWSQAVEFVRALQETRQPHLFVWGQDGHGQRAVMPAGGGERVMPLDLRADRSLPAFTRSSLDDDPGKGDSASGSPAGQINAHLTWVTDSIVDDPGQWAVTLQLVERAEPVVATADVTPRRLQRFKLRPGDAVMWTNRIGERVVQSGELTADRWGLATLPQVQIARGGSRVTMELKPSSTTR